MELKITRIHANVNGAQQNGYHNNSSDLNLILERDENCILLINSYW